MGNVVAGTFNWCCMH